MTGMFAWICAIAAGMFTLGAACFFDKASSEGIATANENAAYANERAATLELKATQLKSELDREIQKHAARRLSDEQIAILSKDLKGKISEIAFVVQNDLEAKAFARQLLSAIPAAKIFDVEPPREDRWFGEPGVVIYRPGSTGQNELKDDPLYTALHRANLFGGTAAKPYTSLQFRGPSPALIPNYDGYVIYVGQRSPF